ncbi:hypothetical protein LMG2828_01749 [Achromobacter piechaudii]|uniref:Panacea domain-containing protein n=1 Tax=Achromobacter piechaudii TaxID=72556 RepID=UPI001464F678|nr:Panacea domain-containing protein [Achromobacter piechaudii]CAB3847135.1 hypothetical protein LMG2828_01749 [Achromobacter piechaudii]
MNKFSRNRLINAVIYFARNTQACGKIKLFKLLYLLDFEHFKQTGKSVTGFTYQAWKFGPVPVALMEEWEQPREDIQQAVEVVPVKVIDFYREEVRVRDGVEFDDEDFSPRELRIMAELVAKYGRAFSEAMVDVTHAQNEAWDRVWRDGLGAYDTIPYELAISDDNPQKEALLEVASNDRMYENAVLALSKVPLH